MDKKILKIAAIVAGVFIFLIVILFLISACSKKKFDFYKLQDKMLASAKSYYQSKPDELPRDDGDTRTIALKKLIDAGFMEEPAKMFKDDSISCDGSVTVTNNNGYYLYSPSLTCGKDHRTQLLVDKMLEDSLVESGIGLYEVGDEYIYKGDVKNNFVKFAGQNKLFRIMRVNADGTYRLFEHDGIDTEVWDDKFNATKGNNVGYNDYVINNLNSDIKDRVKAYYNDASVWPDQVKAYIVTQDLCMGKRLEADITKDGSTECSVKLAKQQLGLINVYEYMQASLDENCNSTRSASCQNHNWYANYRDRIWTINGDANDTSKVWYMFQTINSSSASTYHSLYAVFNISDKVTYVTGDGTEGNPYVIR